MSQQTKSGNAFFRKLATFIVDKRKIFFLLYAFAIAFCVFSMNWVEVENDVTTYLPEETETRQGLVAMNENFVTFGTARIMVSNITLETADELQETIADVEGVDMVTFDHTEEHYRSAAALYDVSFKAGTNEALSLQAMDNIRQALSGYDTYVDTLVGYDENALLQQEMTTILIVAAIIIVIVLTLTSRSYAELPVLIMTFGVAALLNMGTNFLCGKISFISDSIAVVLQLALAIDYAIILCHRYVDERENLDAREACINALSKSIPEISASSMTTISGLAALAFMQFAIGMDMAIVLIKSIFLSLLSVFTLMPGLLMLFSSWMDRTKHKKLLPNVTLLGKFAIVTRRIVPPLFILVLVGAFYFSSQCPYCYSYNDLHTAKMSERQQAYFKIKDTFGTSNMVALVVPAGNYEAERAILKELESRPEVKSAMGLSNIEAMGGYMLTDALTPRELSELVGLDYEVAQVLYSLYAVEDSEYGELLSGLEEYRVPLFDMFLFLKDQLESKNIALEGEDREMLDELFVQLENAQLQLQNEKYSRMVVYLNLAEEGGETYAFLQEIRNVVGEYYEDDYYVVGNSTSSRDLSASFISDNLMISILSAFFVILVLLFTFQSVGLPILLIIVIQGSIWINFSFPTLTGQPLYFLGYLIVNAIQMGANIDYAIVISSHYQEYKHHLPHKKAIVEALNSAFPTVFTSGTMMAAAGLLIGNLSAQPVVSIMGSCLGRGTVISIILVLTVLPAFLVLGDSIIERTKFKIKPIELNTRTATGTMRVQGHLRGYISGVVDADFHGILHGQLNATVSTDAQITDIPEEEPEKKTEDSVPQEPVASVTQMKEADKSARSVSPATSANPAKRNATGRKKGKMTLRKFIKSLKVILLCAILVQNVTLTVQAETEEVKKDTLRISTVEEFLVFAENCRLDSYSMDLPVVLEADIDLTGTDFRGIPIFCGDFDGGNYTVSGLSIKGEGSVQGLFRYVAKGATVRRLVVKGEVIPEGSRCSIGGIAGNNAGIIEGCNFYGYVSGAEAIGGLVGVNEMTGIVDNCLVKGTVHGTHFVGGLVGENYGVVRDSSSDSEINTTVEQNIVEISDITLETLTGTESSATVTDIGGIAGTNIGVIRSCENLGAVGYQQMGYNIGGIAGSQCGYIVDCSNYADVYGRKEVGGIVGHMEPGILVEYTIDTLQILEEQLNTMDAIADGASAKAESSVASLRSQTDTLKGQVEDAQTALGAFSSMPDSDSALAIQNNLSNSLNEMSETLQGMSNTGQETVKNLSNRVKSMVNQMNAIESTVENAGDNLGGSITDVSDLDTVVDITSKVENCFNTGAIHADLNAGGIVGVIALESDLDSEDDVEIIGDASLNFEGELRSVILESENRGAISVGKQNAGGIVGRMDLGLVRDCLNTGAVDAENADYVGGIAGQSRGYIRLSNAKCSLAGDSYVGGVAGSGRIVSDCRTLIQFLGGTERLGAVLGAAAEPYTEDENPVSGNYYLVTDKDMGAIDGISYAGCAEPLEEDAFFALAGLSNVFRKIDIKFVFEDERTKTLQLDWREELTKEDIPEIPEKNGCTGYWEGIEEIDFSDIHFDMTFHVGYNSRFVTIQSEAVQSDNRPIVLAEGDFVPEQQIVLTKLSEVPGLAEGETGIEAWEFAVVPAGQVNTLRYYMPGDYREETLKLLVRGSEGAWRRVPFEKDGSYLVFSVNEEDNAFRLIQVEKEYPVEAWIVAGVAVVSLVLILIFMKKWKKQG